MNGKQQQAEVTAGGGDSRGAAEIDMFLGERKTYALGIMFFYSKIGCPDL
jgi:hypothetical protein